MALEKSPFMWGVVRRGGLPSKWDTGHHSDGQRRPPPGPAGTGSPPSDQGNLKNQRPVMVGSPKGPGCLGLKTFLGCRTFIAKPRDVPGKLATLSVCVVHRCAGQSAA